MVVRRVFLRRWRREAAASSFRQIEHDDDMMDNGWEARRRGGVGWLGSSTRAGTTTSISSAHTAPATAPMAMAAAKRFFIALLPVWCLLREDAAGAGHIGLIWALSTETTAHLFIV